MEKEALHQAIETLKPESLRRLSEFVDYLQYKEQQKLDPQQRKEALKQIEALFAPVHKAVEESGMTEDEINALIDEAIDEVRVSKTRVVFDTQIYVRALINRHSAPGRLLFDLDDFYQLHISQGIEDEIVNVLSRAKIRRKFSHVNSQTVEQLRTLLHSIAIYEVIRPEDIESVCRDPKDDIFLACAKIAQADYLVSEDQDLLVLKQHHQTQIVNVTAFLSVLESKQ